MNAASTRERDEQRQVLGQPVVAATQADHLEHGLDADQLERDVGHRRHEPGHSDGEAEAAVVVPAADEVGGRDVAVPAKTAWSKKETYCFHTAKILARQWTIRVNVVAPGVNNAGMAEQSVRSGKYDSFVDRQIIPRFGRPEDVARAILVLLQPDNYITGQVLAVDGGLSLRI